MIVNKDSNPEKEVYHLGGLLIEVLSESTDIKTDFFQAFQALNKKMKVSMGLFTLTVDWLFLLGTIKSDGKYIEQCF